MSERRWTKDDIRAARLLHEAGQTWAEIAGGFGSTKGALRAAVDRRRVRIQAEEAEPELDLAKSTADICGDWRVIGRKAEGDPPIRWQYVGTFGDPKTRAFLRAEIGQGRVLGASRLHTRADGTREWLWLVRLPAPAYRRAR